MDIPDVEGARRARLRTVRREPRAARGSVAVVSTVDALTSGIRERILAATWAPGARLPESPLAAEYGVSRHTLRAALARLTASGLLAFSPNLGWAVPLLTKEDFDDIEFLRVALEVQAMREITRRREGLGPEAEAALAAIKATPEEPDWVEALRIDMDFHRAVVEQAGGHRLTAVYRDVQTTLQLYLVQRREWFGRQSVAEWKAAHEQVARAVASGDPNRIEALLRSNFDYLVDAGATSTPDR